MSKNDCVNKAYELYVNLQNRIKEVYLISEEYPIFKAELEEILYNAEEYMHDLFIGIAFAYGEMSEEEAEFINKLKTMPAPNNYILDETHEIESVVSRIPLYVELADQVDKYAENTNYTEEFINTTRDICKLLQDADGNTYSNESSFMYGVTDKLEKFFKEREKRNEK